MSVQKSRFAAAYEAQQVVEQSVMAQCAARRREAVPESRRARRCDHAEPAEMLTPQGPIAVAVQNLSTSGASVLLAEAAAFLDSGQSVSLRLCDGRHLHGRIVRAEPGRVGIMFDDELASVDDILHFETRGAAVYSGMVRHAARRQEG